MHVSTLLHKSEDNGLVQASWDYIKEYGTCLHNKTVKKRTSVGERLSAQFLKTMSVPDRRCMRKTTLTSNRNVLPSDGVDGGDGIEEPTEHPDDSDNDLATMVEEDFLYRLERVLDVKSGVGNKQN